MLKMKNRYSYNIDFANTQHSQPSQIIQQQQIRTTTQRKYSRNQQNKCDYPNLNCVSRYKNGYHFKLKEELKLHSRNAYYLSQISNQQRQLKQFFVLNENEGQAPSQNTSLLPSYRSFQKIHTISQQGDQDQLDSLYALQQQMEEHMN